MKCLVFSFPFFNVFRDLVDILIKYQPKSGVNLAIEFCGVAVFLSHIPCHSHFWSLFLSSRSYLFTRVQRGSMPRRSWTSWTHREKSFGQFFLHYLSLAAEMTKLSTEGERFLAIACGFVFLDIVCIRKIAFVFLVTTSRISASSGGISPRLWFWTTCPIHTRTM